jgi:hypothetical protein
MVKGFNQYSELKVDKRPQRGGWAPGDYICQCHDCLDHFGGDKRATQCADCAYKVDEPGELFGTPTPPPVDVLALVTQIDGGMGQLIEKLDRITRFEVIDETGRAYVRDRGAKIQLSLQDDGLTLKVFVGKR